jgi:hypothetical protein
VLILERDGLERIELGMTEGAVVPHQRSDSQQFVDLDREAREHLAAIEEIARL